LKVLATVLSAVSLALCVQGLPAASAARRSRPKQPPPSLSLAHPIYAATKAETAMHRNFDAAHGLLDEEAEGNGGTRYAFAWSTSQALAADIAVAKASRSPAALAQVHRDLTGLSHYWAGTASPPGYDSAVTPPLGHGGARFYDDNAWIGLDLVHAYQLLGEPALLQRAEEVFVFTESGWDANPSHPFPGGVFWTQAPTNRDRNTISTGGAANLGLQLYLINGHKADLETASSMLAWINATLRAPNGLYWDHVGLNGRIDTRQWSYNQGMMLGAYLALYRATGELTALHQAKAIAAASLRLFRASGFHNQPAIFNAIYFRNLGELNTVVPNKSYVDAMRTFVDSIDSLVPRRTGLIQLRGSTQTYLLDQAAATTANAYLALAQQ
jgi:glycosyl hydrolase family 76